MTKRKENPQPGGRPTKYDPSLCVDLIDFFNRPLYKKKIQRVLIDGEWTDKEVEVANDSPWLIDWCMKHDICVDTPSNWAKKFPEFFLAYNKAKLLQERFFAELGIKGEHNGFMTFQTLKNVSGWRDKHETDINMKFELSDDIEKARKRTRESVIGALNGQSAN